jgi:L-lactate dehydrogenase (cytochrome)
MSEPIGEIAPSAPTPALAQRVTKIVPRPLKGVLSLDDFERRAQRFLPRSIFGYVAGATETNASLAANRRDFSAVGFVPRMLRDVGSRSLGRAVLGRNYALPFGIAPMGLCALAALDGDIALAQAAREAGIPGVMSATSLTRLERVAVEAGSRWFQAYLSGDDARILAMLDRVAAAGFEVLVLTVDVPVSANRENNIRNGFDSPLKPSLRLAYQGVTHPGWLIGTAGRTLMRHGMPHFENMDATRGPPILSSNVVRSMAGRDRFTWRHVDLIRRRWKGQLVLKGLLAPEDGRLARESGVDGIIVSNHGGRQLDYAISALRALQAIKAGAGSLAVMLDGGIRRGTDVLKALALGADFVFVGRPFLYAAAIGGQAGVKHAIEILSTEVDRDMTLVGVRNLDELSPALLAPSFDRPFELRGAGAPVDR